MSESDTPRTDSFAREHAHLCEAIGGYVYPRAIELARALERENAALLARTIKLADQIDGQAAIIRESCFPVNEREGRLLSELAALRLDKERLDWLASHHHWILCAETNPTGTFLCGRNDNFRNWAEKVKDVRSAIDAARQPGGKEGK